MLGKLNWSFIIRVIEVFRTLSVRNLWHLCVAVLALGCLVLVLVYLDGVGEVMLLIYDNLVVVLWLPFSYDVVSSKSFKTSLIPLTLDIFNLFSLHAVVDHSSNILCVVCVHEIIRPRLSILLADVLHLQSTCRSPLCRLLISN